MWNKNNPAWSKAYLANIHCITLGDLTICPYLHLAVAVFKLLDTPANDVPGKSPNHSTIYPIYSKHSFSDGWIAITAI
jgi:hypothetical protein